MNATDPTGTQTEIELRGYPLDNVPDGEGNGHLFVQATDTVTGESVIARGGPSGDYLAQTGSSPIDDIATKASNGLDLVGSIGDASASIDFGQGGEELVDSITVEDDFADVVQGLTDRVNEVNNAGVGYTPLGPNSNTFATGAFGGVAGRKADLSNKSYTYPGATTRDPLAPRPERNIRCTGCP